MKKNKYMVGDIVRGLNPWIGDHFKEGDFGEVVIVNDFDYYVRFAGSWNKELVAKQQIEFILRPTRNLSFLDIWKIKMSNKLFVGRYF